VLRLKTCSLKNVFFCRDSTKTPLLLSKTTVSSLSIGDGNYKTPCTFGEDESTLINRFITADHVPSVMNMSCMLLSCKAYPSSKLISYFMQKLVLEAKDDTTATKAIQFLNSTLLLHSPSKDYINSNHIYLQAMTVSYESTTTFNVPFSERTMAWPVGSNCSPQWSFFSSVIRDALVVSEDDSRLQHNASLLLVKFLGRLATTDNKTIRKLLSWRKHLPIRPTTAFEELVGFYRKSLELKMKTKSNLVLVRCKTNKPPSSAVDEKGILSVTEATRLHQNASGVSRTLRDIIFATADFIPTTQGDINEGMSVISNSIANEVKNFSRIRHPLLTCLLNDLKCSKLQEPVTQAIFRKTCSPLLSANGLQSNLGFEDKSPSCDLFNRVATYLCFVPRISEDGEGYENKSRTKLNGKRPRCFVDTDDDDDDDKCYDWMSDSDEKEQMVAEQKRKKAKRMTKTKSHSSKDVNDKNNKGETKLHRAVVSNKPAKIRKILQIPGVNPNAGCNFGWTPLAEACNKGYIGCVKELLRLPTGRTNKNEIKMGMMPKLCIDLEECPESEGITPLHEAIEEGYTDIVRMILAKGGHQMLYKPNKMGNSPLDMCQTSEARSEIEQIGISLQNRCELDAEGEVQGESKYKFSNSSIRRISELLPADSDYTKMFHCVTSYNASRLWTDACRCYMAMVRSLFLSYMDKTDLHRLVCELITKDATEGQHKLENNEDNCTMKSDDADDSCEEIPNKLSRVEINDKIERITLIVSWLADRRLII